jgi:hypothetical protein
MAKRYHDSDRPHTKETKSGKIGHFKEADYHMRDYYSGMEARRRMEMQDAGMINEDHRAIANLPQDVKITPYPKTGPYLPEGLDDTIRGVDHQMDYDDSQAKRHFYPKKV